MLSHGRRAALRSRLWRAGLRRLRRSLPVSKRADDWHPFIASQPCFRVAAGIVTEGRSSANRPTATEPLFSPLVRSSTDAELPPVSWGRLIGRAQCTHQ